MRILTFFKIILIKRNAHFRFGANERFSYVTNNANRPHGVSAHC